MTAAYDDIRDLLISGGVPPGPPAPAGYPQRAGWPDITPVPVDESAAGREDWHAEVVGTMWMRSP